MISITKLFFIEIEHLGKKLFIKKTIATPNFLDR